MKLNGSWVVVQCRFCTDSLLRVRLGKAEKDRSGERQAAP